VDDPIVSIPGNEITPWIIDLGKTSGEGDDGSNICLSRGDQDTAKSENARHPCVMKNIHDKIQRELDLVDAHVEVEDTIHPAVLKLQGWSPTVFVLDQASADLAECSDANTHTAIKRPLHDRN
jgi:hypothetical protein